MSEPIRVLHVDDDPEFAELTAAFLDRADGAFEIETAADAAEGLDRLEDGAFDCIVSDHEMPGRNGIEFLETVREVDPDLPFVLFTGKGSEQVASDAISAGATDYLQKGSSTERYELLANRIRNAVSQFRSKRAEQRLVELAENTEQVLFVFDAAWSDLLFVSAAYETVWGRPAEELRSDPADFLEGVHPDDRETVRDAMATLSDGDRTEIEVRVNPTEEYRRWVRIRGEPIRGEAGEVVRIAGFGSEITAERRRRRRRERQRETLVELATDEAVASGEFETAIRRITETTAEVLDVDRVNVWLREDDADGLVCVDDYDRERDAHAETTDLSIPVQSPYFEALETNRAIAVDDVRTDPRTSDLESYLEAHDVGAVLDGTLRSGGEIVGTICHEHVGGPRTWTDDEIEFVGDVADVVHRALRNRERREQQRELRRYESIVESLADAVYALDGDGTIEFVNDRYAEMKGVPREELIGTSIGQWVDETVLDETEPMYEAVKQGDREVGRIEYEFRTADGESIPAELRFAALPDPDGTPGRVGVIRDITERRRREEQLERRNERLAEFASVVSHDLRNPLGVARGNVDLLRATCDDDRLDTVENALDRMDALIDDLLTLAREGESTAETEPTALTAAVESCWANVDTGSATLTVEGDVRIHADRSRLQQLFENLFRNAVEHASTGSRTAADDGSEHGSTGGRSRSGDGAEHTRSDVTVRVGELDDGSGFFVEDDGPGIPEEQRDLVFDSGYSSTSDGTGFGLTIVERVADAHGWEVRVTSGSDGGARFEFTGVERP